jgi:hypothetical protein
MRSGPVATCGPTARGRSRRGPGPDPGGGPAHPLGRQPAGLGLRRLHRPRTARPAGQGVARRPSRRRVGGDDRAGGRRLRRRPAVRPDPVRPGSGDDERHGGRRRPGHRQRPWGACTTRRWRGGCWTFARIGSARCWSASGTPPTARWCRSSGPTGARSTRSCTAATGSGPYPLLVGAVRAGDTPHQVALRSTLVRPSRCQPLESRCPAIGPGSSEADSGEPHPLPTT